MATTSIDGDVDNWWRELFRPLLNFMRKAAKRRRSSGSRRSINLWEENSRAHEAILALRMAANFRGEDYEAVAARIEKEVARYREFLQQPEPIGKISLVVKRFPLDGEDDEPPRQLYQVRDPTQGQASVLYNFERSDRIVLEVVVHDRYDRPLFPIVRTYSNWIGKRQFNLGLGRTFTLSMAASDASACVRVHAGFKTALADEIEDTDMAVATGDLTLAANTIHNGGSLQIQTDAFRWSYRRRLALLLCVECLVVSVIASRLVGQAATNQLMNAPAAADISQASGSAPVTAQAFAGNSDGEAHGITFYISGGGGEESGVDESRNFGGSDKGTRARDGNALQTTRIAALVGGRLKLDDALCGGGGDGCHELRVSIDGNGDKVFYLHVGHTLSPVRRNTAQTFEPPLTAHQHGEANSGLIHVTLFTRNRLLLLKEAGCAGNNEGGANYFASNSLEGLSRETAADVHLISESTESRVEAQGNGAAERETRLLIVD